MYAKCHFIILKNLPGHDVTRPNSAHELQGMNTVCQFVLAETQYLFSRLSIPQLHEFLARHFVGWWQVGIFPIGNDTVCIRIDTVDAQMEFDRLTASENADYVVENLLTGEVASDGNLFDDVIIFAL